MTIIESMTLALAGQYNVMVGTEDTTFLNYTAVDGSVLNLTAVYTADTTWSGAELAEEDTSGPRNGTIIGSTTLNLLDNAYNSTAGPNLVVNGDTLNEMLQNVTLSLMNNFGIWTREVEATQSTLRNVYSFSNKLNLLLPYYVTLLVALPLLVIGGWSMRENGVTATDGGFLQILTTTSRSEQLRQAAAAGSLGGEENVPEELKELKIMFGKLIGDKGDRGVGFGVADEVVRIERKGRYEKIDGAQLHADSTSAGT